MQTSAKRGDCSHLLTSFQLPNKKFAEFLVNAG